MAKPTLPENEPGTDGVQDLIDRLKVDGIARGQQQAEAVVADARRQSKLLLDAAKHEAETLLAAARDKAAQIEERGKQALQLARRDTVLQLMDSFQRECERELGKLVSQTLSDPQFVQQLILEVARQATPADAESAMHVLVPAAIVGDRPSDTLTDRSAAQFVAGLAADLLRDGVTLAAMETTTGGIRVQLLDQDVEVDLTEETVAELLNRFLSPHYRALLHP